MAQIWFLCSLQVNLSRMESSPKGQWNTQKNYPWKKSHEELYQILIPNTVTSIYVHCTGPDLPQSLGERNRAGACGLAWNVCGELLDSPLKAGKRGWSLINWWSIRYHSLSLRSVDHEFGALTTKLMLLVKVQNLTPTWWEPVTWGELGLEQVPNPRLWGIFPGVVVLALLHCLVSL